MKNPLPHLGTGRDEVARGAPSLDFSVGTGYSCRPSRVTVSHPYREENRDESEGPRQPRPPPVPPGRRGRGARFHSLAARVTAAAKPNTKLGGSGSGRIGGSGGALWVKAGHDLMVSSRNLDEVNKLIDGLWPKPPAGFPKEAVPFGEVILVVVPYAALPQIGKDPAAEPKGTVVFVGSKCRLGRADMAEAANEPACSPRRLQRLDRHA